MATLDQVLSQMQAADLPPLPQGHPIADGKIHRFGREKKCWYILFDYPARNGKRYIAGAFGRWAGTDNGKIIVKSDYAGMEPDELQRLQRSQAALQAREQEKRAQRARFAGNRARQQWDAARAKLQEGEPPPPYLVRKRLDWEKGLRVYADGTLLVPMIRFDITEEQEKDPAYTGPRRLVGVQKIRPDGFKLFNKHMEKVGAGARFGRRRRTASSSWSARACRPCCRRTRSSSGRTPRSWRSTAGNLLPLARILRALFPKSPLLFLADDDAYLEAQLNKRLQKDYGVTQLYKVLDGERTMQAKHGPLSVRADLHVDPRGTPLLTVGIRRGDEAARTFTIINAGRTKAWEAAGGGWQRMGDLAEVRRPQARPRARHVPAHGLQRPARGGRRRGGGRAGRRRDQGDRGRARARQVARCGARQRPRRRKAPPAAVGVGAGMTSPTGSCTAR
jgi:putative DNA primase/helicase